MPHTPIAICRSGWAVEVHISTLPEVMTRIQRLSSGYTEKKNHDQRRAPDDRSFQFVLPFSPVTVNAFLMRRLS